jgi:hypothetical protein
MILALQLLMIDGQAEAAQSMQPTLGASLSWNVSLYRFIINNKNSRLVYVRGWDLEVTQSQKEKFSSSSAFY